MQPLLAGIYFLFSIGDWAPTLVRALLSSVLATAASLAVYRFAKQRHRQEREDEPRRPPQATDDEEFQ
jgi:hypothetical protein